MTRLLLAALLFAAPGTARAGASTGAGTLRRPLSARMVALSEAYGAIPAGLSSLGANPAGLAAEKKVALETTFASGVIDDGFGFLGAAVPTPFAVLSVGAAYYDGGKATFVYSNGTQSVRTAQRDMVGLLAAAREVGAGVSVGATAKWYRFELAQEARANGSAFDAGAQWRAPLKGLVLGAALQNAGASTRFEQESDPLPTAWRGGASWTWETQPDRKEDVLGLYDGMRAVLSAEALKVREEKTAALVGGEFALDFNGTTSVAVRVGHAFNRDISGASFGFGVRERAFSVDYAFDAKGALGNAHHVTLGARF